MSNLIDIEGYEAKGIKIDPNGTEGETVELHGLLVVLPKKPRKSEILFHDQPKKLQLHLLKIYQKFGLMIRLKKRLIPLKHKPRLKENLFLWAYELQLQDNVMDLI